MSVGNVTRVIVVLAACLPAAACATSSANQPAPASGPGQQESPPPPQEMEAVRALGLWRSTFGAVKIEADNSHGGLSSGSLQGVWLYERQGQEVIGYFAGNLRGNVLQFHWQEPNNPPLTGEGYLVFDVQGRQYSGRWWSDQRDRVGDWDGWRQPVRGTAQAGTDPGQPGAQGSSYGQPSPYVRRPYQSQPYQPQPYQQPQPYSQPPPYQQPQPAQQPQQPAPIRYN